jgi:ATP-dependent Lon protease
MVVPLFVGRDKSIRAIEKAERQGSIILLVAQNNAATDLPKPSDLYSVGTLAELIQLLKLPDGTIKVLAEGTKRVKIHRFIQKSDHLVAEVDEVEEDNTITPDIETMMHEVVSRFEEYVKLSSKIPPETVVAASTINDPHRLVDMVVSHLQIKLENRQAMLDTFPVAERLGKLNKIIKAEMGVLKIEKRIRGRVKNQMEKTQKEYYLNEQMKAIQKELGDKDDHRTEIELLYKNVKEAKMSKEAEERANKEIKRFSQMPPMSAEGTVVLNYLDWLISLPWSKKTREILKTERAEKILDEDHYGLKKPKERILEYLAVRQLVKKMRGQVLCFVGPPGVGKTSLARSIARSMGRNFVRISLGGVRDEAEIRGHRRTYVGALPGRIIQGIKKAKSKNAVFLLDEVDKMSTDFRGDPSAALLEVLDVEQNNAFNDHYLEVDFDLSEVMFITTANTLHRIPQPLLDRMEIIQLSSYTEEEKIKIAERFLVPKQRKAHGLKEKNISISSSALASIIRLYAREAGVRNLEREIAAIYRKIARIILKKGRDTHLTITHKNLSKYLGIPRFRHRIAEEGPDEVGLSVGLAWTEVGGEILMTEVSIMEGKGKLIITGQLGDVMKESAQAALSHIRSISKSLGLTKGLFSKIDIHLHVPEGAIPKDGPSAGITIATALASALTNRKVKKDIAMTGEITLRGRVLPIGGLKEKTLAAHRAEIYKIIIPKHNEKDLEDIPKKVKNMITFYPVEHIEEVLKLTLHEKPDETLEKQAIPLEETTSPPTEIIDPPPHIIKH